MISSDGPLAPPVTNAALRVLKLDDIARVLCVPCGSASGTGSVHGLKGTVDWGVTGRLAAGSIPATILTLFALYILGIKGNDSPPLITTALGIALVMTAVCVLSHRWLRLLTATRHAEPDPRWTATLTTFAGLLLGVFVTLSSVGAGAIGMTALVLLYPRTPIARLVGSDIAHAVPLTLIAGVGHWLLGSVDWILLGSLVIGSLPGIFFGSHLSARVPDKVLPPYHSAINRTEPPGWWNAKTAAPSAPANQSCDRAGPHQVGRRALAQRPNERCERRHGEPMECRSGRPPIAVQRSCHSKRPDALGRRQHHPAEIRAKNKTLIRISGFRPGSPGRWSAAFSAASQSWSIATTGSSSAVSGMPRSSFSAIPLHANTTPT